MKKSEILLLISKCEKIVNSIKLLEQSRTAFNYLELAKNKIKNENSIYLKRLEQLEDSLINNINNNYIR